MKITFPKYYKNFKCKADKCKNNCCIGWEIDVDEETMKLYKSIDDTTGTNLTANIEDNHFKLKENERCVFLRDDGLCDIICNYGEDALCNICTLHPRFQNFYKSFNEIGLGIACEEASKIILSDEEDFDISVPCGVSLTDEENDFFNKRSKVFKILQNKEKSFETRFFELCDKFNIEIPFDTNKLLKIYFPLERLDDKWTKELEALKGFEFDENIFCRFEKAFENLAVYFVFRHFGKGMQYGEYDNVIKFALLGCTLIGAILSKHEKDNEAVDFDKLTDLARMYSAEIEYSDENTEALMYVEI